MKILVGLILASDLNSVTLKITRNSWSNRSFCSHWNIPFSCLFSSSRCAFKSCVCFLNGKLKSKLGLPLVPETFRGVKANFQAHQLWFFSWRKPKDVITKMISSCLEMNSHKSTGNMCENCLKATRRVTLKNVDLALKNMISGLLNVAGIFIQMPGTKA